MEATDFSTFHRWLLCKAAPGTPSILIHGQRELPLCLAASVARHLNEYDEDAGGNWLALSPALVESIAETSLQRGLLLPDRCCQCTATGRECSHLRETLQALAAHGQAILQGEVAMQACSGKADVFRIWLGSPPDTADTLHLILHPEHFNGHSLPAIIGDTFLEWVDARLLSAAE